MRYEKYKNELAFWKDLFGDEFFDFIDKYKIDLEKDEYNLLSVTASNKTIIKNRFKNLEDFDNYFENLIKENRSINFRSPNIFIQEKKAVPVSEDDFEPFNLEKELKAVKPLLEKNYAVMLEINKSLKELANDINFDINDSQMEKLKLIFERVYDEIAEIKSSIINKDTGKLKKDSLLSVKEKITLLYSKYSLLFIILLILILIIRW